MKICKAISAHILVTLFFMLSSFLFAGPSAKEIELKSKDGKKITGVILSVGEDTLRIRRSDKKEFDIPFSRLTEESVKAAQKLTAKKEGEEDGKADGEGDEKRKTLPPIDKDAKHPKGVNLKLMSEDASYGYSEKNPILVGSKEEYGGPKAERAFFESLLDGKGKEISFRRLASGGVGPGGGPLDFYEVTTGEGTKVILWIDMYHPKKDPGKQPAPVGFYKKR